MTKKLKAVCTRDADADADTVKLSVFLSLESTRGYIMYGIDICSATCRLDTYTSDGARELRRTIGKKSQQPRLDYS